MLILLNDFPINSKNTDNVYRSNSWLENIKYFKCRLTFITNVSHLYYNSVVVADLFTVLVPNNSANRLRSDGILGFFQLYCRVHEETLKGRD